MYSGITVLTIGLFIRLRSLYRTVFKYILGCCVSRAYTEKHTAWIRSGSTGLITGRRLKRTLADFI